MADEQVVYIDVLFVVNLALNYFILLSVSGMLHRQEKRLRLFAGAALGAFYALFIFFPSMGFLYSAALKLVASALIVLAACRVRGFWDFCKVLAGFYGISVAFGGVTFALWLFVAPRGMAWRNGVAYFDIPPLLLIACGGVCYILVTLLSRFLHRNAQPQARGTLVVRVGSASAELPALLDTGNALCDMLTGAPVIVAAYAPLRRRIPEPLREGFRSGAPPDASAAAGAGWERRLRILPFSSVGKQNGVMPAFRPDLVEITCGGRTIRTDRCLIAVSPDPLSPDNSVCALLSPHLFTELADRPAGEEAQPGRV